MADSNFKDIKYDQRTLLGAALISIGVLTGAANAAVIINITDNGTDTIITASGSFNVTDLTRTTTGGGGGLDPVSGFLEINNSAFEIFQGISGPSSFGTGGYRALSRATGDRMGVRWGAGQAITAPAGYVSGDPLAASGSITGVGFGDLGITPGVYEWTWGSGPSADTLTVIASAVPEPSSTLLFGLGFLRLAAMRKRR